MFERYGSFIVAPVCKNWSRLRLNANSTQNVSKWEDIGRITMVLEFGITLSSGHVEQPCCVFKN
jgi:hypothetical protein